MRNMYAVKCLYKWDIYDSGGALLNETTYHWEERIILITASSIEDADCKSEKFAKEYEQEYTNTDNQLVKIKLYAIVDIFAIFDTNSRTNIEVYSNLFDATEEQVEKMLDIEYQIDKQLICNITSKMNVYYEWIQNNYSKQTYKEN